MAGLNTGGVKPKDGIDSVIDDALSVFSWEPGAKYSPATIAQKGLTKMGVAEDSILHPIVGTVANAALAFPGLAKSTPQAAYNLGKMGINAIKSAPSAMKAVSKIPGLGLFGGGGKVATETMIQANKPNLASTAVKTSEQLAKDNARIIPTSQRTWSEITADADAMAGANKARGVGIPAANRAEQLANEGYVSTKGIEKAGAGVGTAEKTAIGFTKPTWKTPAFAAGVGVVGGNDTAKLLESGDNKEVAPTTTQKAAGGATKSTPAQPATSTTPASFAGLPPVYQNDDANTYAERLRSQGISEDQIGAAMKEFGHTAVPSKDYVSDFSTLPDALKAKGVSEESIKKVLEANGGDGWRQTVDKVGDFTAIDEELKTNHDKYWKSAPTVAYVPATEIGATGPGIANTAQTTVQPTAAPTAFGPTPYDPLIAQASQKYGVPEQLIKALIKQESGFDPNAANTTDGGSYGLMQLQRPTAKGLGVTNIMDPAQNVDGGVRYLSEMMNKYNGDVAKALTAYNWGPGNLDKAGGDISRAPQSTKQYVANIMGNYGMNGATSSATQPVPTTPATRQFPGMGANGVEVLSGANFTNRPEWHGERGGVERGLAREGLEQAVRSQDIDAIKTASEAMSNIEQGLGVPGRNEAAMAAAKSMGDYRTAVTEETKIKNFNDKVKAFGENNETGAMDMELAYFQIAKDDPNLESVPDNMKGPVSAAVLPLINAIKAKEAERGRPLNTVERIILEQMYRQSRGWPYDSAMLEKYGIK